VEQHLPGQVLFFPIIDVTWEYINFLFLSFGDEHYQMVDDKTGKPAGVGKWVDNGFLSGAPVPISMLELLVFNVCVASGHYMAQNIDLARAALGLGGYVWGGYLSLILLGGTPLTTGLGLRFGTGKDGMPTALGKDGYVESLTPPYVKDMDEAVDRVVELKFGSGGLFSPERGDYRLHEGLLPLRVRDLRAFSGHGRRGADADLRDRAAHRSRLLR